MEERMKTTEGFLVLVCEMRKFQELYYATRSPMVLGEVKRKEKAVDEYIEYHLKKLTGGIPHQGALYDE
jgi:hypothetical protein